MGEDTATLGKVVGLVKANLYCTALKLWAAKQFSKHRNVLYTEITRKYIDEAIELVLEALKEFYPEGYSDVVKYLSYVEEEGE